MSYGSYVAIEDIGYVPGPVAKAFPNTKMMVMQWHLS
jgi:hypothetical protein